MAPELQREYLGDELTLFAHAKVWARYIEESLSPFLRGTVIEVGAGLGTRTGALAKYAERWVAIEPDPLMSEKLAGAVSAGELPSHVEPFAGRLAELPAAEQADAIIYVDVLEHIEDDRAELALAATHLRPGGHLLVLSPAHAWLYTPFDKAVGHYRRYSRAGLVAVGPPSLRVVRKRMLDSVGLAASAANRLILRSAQPTIRQIKLWDRVMVRSSRLVDRLVLYQLGKSVLVVWHKPPGDAVNA